MSDTRFKEGYPAYLRRNCGHAYDDHGPDEQCPDAKWLGVSAGWVRDHATRKEPRLRAVKVGKLLRFRPEDIEDFLRTCTGEIGN